MPYLDPACGDHKIIWELNRHQHFLALGRAWWLAGHRPARATFVRHLASWMDANPPLVGINWASMLELALRSLSWIWALELFVEPAAGDDPRDDQPIDAHPWLVDLLLGLDRQLHLVEQNLSTYFSPNTHLLGEALALYVAGRTLPELRRAPAWAELGRRILIEEMSRQISPDGGHVERSFHYHRYTLDFYLLALAVARLTGDDTRPFAEAARRLARFARTIADDRGHLARIGDDDGGQLFPICGRDSADASDTLALAAWLLGDPSLAVGPAPEETAWMSGGAAAIAVARRTATPIPSTTLGDSGYTVCRTGRGDHLVLDTGPHGYLNGGHAHADALSMTLTVAGRPLLVDPGTACYTIDPSRRDRFRSTRLHNTLVLDGREQSEPAGPFHWASAAAGSRLAWCTSPGFDYVEGTHDGYAPLVHRRAVFSRPGCWIVADRVLGDGDASGRGALASRSALDRHGGRRRLAARRRWRRRSRLDGEPGRRVRDRPRPRDRRRARPRLGRAGLRPRRARHDAAARPSRRGAVHAGDRADRGDGSPVDRGVAGEGRRSHRSHGCRASSRRRRGNGYRRVRIDDTVRRRSRGHAENPTPRRVRPPRERCGTAVVPDTSIAAGYARRRSSMGASCEPSTAVTS